MIVAYACCFCPIQYGGVLQDFVAITVMSGWTQECADTLSASCLDIVPLVLIQENLYTIY